MGGDPDMRDRDVNEIRVFLVRRRWSSSFFSNGLCFVVLIIGAARSGAQVATDLWPLWSAPKDYPGFLKR